MIVCPFGCGERLYPDGNHSNAAEVEKHRRECARLRELRLKDQARKREPRERPAAAAAGPLDDARSPATSNRAARWAWFASAALQGLLASELQDDSINWTKKAAEYADGLLEEHDRRFK